MTLFEFLKKHNGSLSYDKTRDVFLLVAPSPLGDDHDQHDAMYRGVDFAGKDDEAILREFISPAAIMLDTDIEATQGAGRPTFGTPVSSER